MFYMLMILSLFARTNGEIIETCTKEEPCEELTQPFDLPGSKAEWVKAFENIKIVIQQIKTSLRDHGLGPFLGEMADIVKLPGTRSDWAGLLQDVTLETLLNAWNQFLQNIKSVQVSSILQLLNVPGTPSEWKKTFETIQDSFGAEGRLADLVWYFVGAPGSQEQWRGVVQNMQYKIGSLKNIIVEAGDLF